MRNEALLDNLQALAYALEMALAAVLLSLGALLVYRLLVRRPDA